MWEVVLEEQNGDLTGWHGEAYDEHHAVEKAKLACPGLNVVGAMDLGKV